MQPNSCISPKESLQKQKARFRLNFALLFAPFHYIEKPSKVSNRASMSDCQYEKPNVFQFTWVTSGYLCSPRKDIQSPTFSCKLLEGTVWRVGLHISAPGNVHSIHGYLQRVRGRREPEIVYSDLQIKVWQRDCLIIDKVLKDKSALYENQILELFVCPDYTIQLGDFRPSDSELTIQCTFVQTPCQEELLLSLYNSMHLEVLSKDIETLWKDELFYDTIIDVDNTQFKVHRCILEARMPKAAQRLPVNFTSSLLSRSKISDMSSSSMSSLLRYTYSGVLKIPSASELKELILASTSLSMLNLREQIFTGRGHSEADTKLNIQKLSFVWEINRTIPHISDQDSLFLDVPFEKIKSTTMRIYFGVYLTETGEEFLTISFQCPKLEDNCPIHMVCKLSLVNGNCRSFDFKEICHVFDSQTIQCCRPLLSTKDLASVPGGHSLDWPACPLLKFDFQIELCDGETTSGFDITEEEVSMNTTHSKDYGRLRNDLEKLYDNLTFTDMNLLTDGGQSFPTHRCILAARSPVLKNIILNEGSNRCITLPGISGKALSAFLDYIYTGKLKHITREITTELIKVSDYYKIPLLRHRALLQLHIQSKK